MKFIRRGSRRSMRDACLKAIAPQQDETYCVQLERTEREAYGALFVSDRHMVFARIPNRFADQLDVYLTAGKIS